MSEKEDRIKSAFEIAMEKVEKLGSLSQDEKRRMKEAELAEAAQSLAQRHRRGTPLRDIEVDLARFEDEDRARVRQLMLQELLAGIRLEALSPDDSLFESVKALSGDEKSVDNLRQMVIEYRSEIDRAWQENAPRLEAEKRDELARCGISGSAVIPAVDASGEWLKISKDLESQFEARMDAIRKTIKAS